MEEHSALWHKIVIETFGSETAFKEGDWGWHLKMPRTSLQRVHKTVCHRKGIAHECLPLHLIAEHILTRLSVRQCCQLRSVCTAWNSLLTWDPLKTEEAEYWFVLIQPETKELIVCSSQGCCHPLPLPRPILPLVFCYLSVNSEPGLSYVLASAGGLMCASVRSGSGFEVLVFNCLTGAVNVLPRYPCSIFGDNGTCFLYFTVDSEDLCRYYVLLSASPLSTFACDIEHIEVFDSRAGIWKVGQPLHSATTKSSRSKVVDGDFFNWGALTSGDNLSVQAYHVAEDAWSTAQVSLGFSDLDDIHFRAFLKYKGRLFLCFVHVNESSYGLRVLELQSTGTCVEVARTPEHLFQPWNHMARVEAEGHLFYTVWAERSWPQATLVYDLAHDLWHVLPLTDGYILLTAHRPTLSMCLA